LVVSLVVLVLGMVVQTASKPAFEACSFTGLALMMLGLVGLSAAGVKPEWVAVDPMRPSKAEQDAMHVVRRRLHMCSSWNVGLAWRAALLPTPCTDPCPDPIRSRQLRLLPLTPPIVVFWLVYGQQTTCFQLQGMQMNLHTMGTELSAATLNVFDSFGIMLFTPLVDQIIYPAFRNRGRELSMFKKIGAGFVFAALSVIAAGIVEIYRRDSGVAFPGTHDKPPQNHLTIWWQAPQYLLVALAEVLTAITTYELFYVTLPPHLRSIGQGLNL